MKTYFSSTVSNLNLKQNLINNSKKLSDIQIQPSRGALKKRCSENIQQIYKRTHMSKLLCNFTEILLRLGCSPLNLLYLFRTPPRKKTSGVLPLDIIKTYENHRSAQRIKVSNQLIRKGTIPATVLADIVLT